MGRNILRILFVIMLAICFPGCSSPNYNTETTLNSSIETTPIRIAIFSSDVDYETYLMDLNQNGVLEVSFGKQNNQYIDKGGYIKGIGYKIREDIISNNFMTPSVTKKKTLTKSQIEKIEKITREIKSEEITEIDKIILGPIRVITVIINGKIYSFYETDERYNNNLKELVSELTKYSPVEIIKPERL